jgi:hypothetical protein
MDIGTGIGTGLAVTAMAPALKELLVKLFGPSAEYAGGQMSVLVQKQHENLRKIFENAQAKWGDKLEGSVPPKVLKNIVEDGRFCEEDLSVEYFGSVLASSRTEVSRDDRGAAFTSLVGRLTAYQIRTHFFFYGLWKAQFNGRAINVAVPQGRDSMQIFIPMDCYAAAMEFSEKEDFYVFLSHAIIGLAKESLIDSNYNFGMVDPLNGENNPAPEPGILVRPSSFGVELFHWAHARGDVPVHRFLEPTVEFRSNIEIKTVAGSHGMMHKGNDLFGAGQQNIPDERFSTSVSMVNPHQDAPPES